MTTWDMHLIKVGICLAISIGIVVWYLRYR